jgi:hypothetical protein
LLRIAPGLARDKTPVSTSFTAFANFGGRLGLFFCDSAAKLLLKWRRYMNQQSRTVRGALVGATAALGIMSALLVAACAIKQPYDFPVMRLTDPPAADTQARQ